MYVNAILSNFKRPLSFESVVGFFTRLSSANTISWLLYECTAMIPHLSSFITSAFSDGATQLLYDDI